MGFLLPLFVCAQADDAARAIEQAYARIDAALARRDAGEIERIIPAEAWVGFEGFHISLRAWMHEALKHQGWTSRWEVVHVRVAGDTAVVDVRRHITVNRNERKHESVIPFRDTWLRRSHEWVWRESVDLSGAPTPIEDSSLAPATSPEAVRPIIDELKLRANCIATAEPGHGLEDLRAFGEAVGNARIVALGEASHGTSEFCRMKHRLLEYLVREKGFTVLALEVGWPRSLAVDRYIKTWKAICAGFSCPASTRCATWWSGCAPTMSLSPAGGRLLTHPSICKTSWHRQGWWSNT
jgi:erythromycin esterase